MLLRNVQAEQSHPCCSLCDQKGIATKGQHFRTRFIAGNEAHAEDLFGKDKCPFFPISGSQTERSQLKTRHFFPCVGPICDQ